MVRDRQSGRGNHANACWFVAGTDPVKNAVRGRVRPGPGCLLCFATATVHLNLAQKIAVAVTLLAVAVFLFLQAGREYSSRDGMALVIQAEYGRTLWYTTVLDVAGIVLVGGAVTVLLGFKKRKRPGAGE